ncbi:recombination directionality factor [Arthrobacter phage Emotion]|uniref:Recombination directionality factor n=1 Tax=Arthrobacter phage Emotion TaxID=3038361 RepID=A0AA49IEM7_9CAUD|nr:recombination directionality factor [Arthrobacter phage Emotion]
MALKIFGDADTANATPRNKFADDVVGRFRSGHQINKRPAALSEWRVTTGDPEVADKIYDLLGGEAPQEWEANGEDNLEVFTASKAIEVILESSKAIRQRLVLWGRNGKPIYTTDGETKDDGTPDPDAELSFQERKQKGRDGIGPTPDVEVYFRLAADPDLGIFKFQSGSWSLVSDMAYNDTEGELADALADSESGKVKAILKLEQVSFVAKNGPQAGKTVSYTKPVIQIKGAA